MNVTVIIATSFKRTTWLLERSLASVYYQKNCNSTNISVLIVDDNQDDNEVIFLENGISALRQKLGLREEEFSTRILKNSRTKNMSGTGAWNTAIMASYATNPDGYVSLLDDDDAYLTHHLSECIANCKHKNVAIFQSLYWLHSDDTKMELPLSIEQLTPKHFFIGNPGIQGSNMFFKTEHLWAINGFDETLPNTTDRDLMIRFLRYCETQQLIENIVVIPNFGVIHYNHSLEKVNNNLPLKQKGLDLFYAKYRSQFSEDAYQHSIARARLFFNYKPEIEE